MTHRATFWSAGSRLIGQVSHATNASAWPKHLYALDVSRGIAAISVVVWHWQNFAYSGGSLDAEFSKTDQPFYGFLKLLYEKGAMGVEYFFLLSGFVFFWLYRERIQDDAIGVKRFFWQRFSRLYPLHLVTLLLVAALQFAYYSEHGFSFVYENNDLRHFLLNLVFASKWGLDDGWSFNAPVWSVSVEILLYIVFFIVASLRKGGPVFCLMTSFSAFFFAIFFFHPILIGLSLFFLGGFVYQLTAFLAQRGSGSKALIHVIFLLAWSATIVSVYVVDFVEPLKEGSLFGKLLVASFPYFVLFPSTVSSLALLEIDRTLVPRSLSWIGDISYSSYLLHFPLQLVFALFYGQTLLRADGVLERQLFLLFFGLLIALSLLSYKCFELPMKLLIRKRTREKTQTTVIA